MKISSPVVMVTRNSQLPVDTVCKQSTDKPHWKYLYRIYREICSVWNCYCRPR